MIQLLLYNRQRVLLEMVELFKLKTSKFLECQPSDVLVEFTHSENGLGLRWSVDQSQVNPDIAPTEQSTRRLVGVLYEELRKELVIRLKGVGSRRVPWKEKAAVGEGGA